MQQFNYLTELEHFKVKDTNTQASTAPQVDQAIDKFTFS